MKALAKLLLREVLALEKAYNISSDKDGGGVNSESLVSEMRQLVSIANGKGDTSGTTKAALKTRLYNKQQRALRGADDSQYDMTVQSILNRAISLL